MNTKLLYDILRGVHNCIEAIAALENMDEYLVSETLEFARESCKRAEKGLAEIALHEMKNAETVHLALLANDKIER